MTISTFVQMYTCTNLYINVQLKVYCMCSCNSVFKKFLGNEVMNMDNPNNEFSIEEYEKIASSIKVLDLPKAVLAFYNSRLTEIDLYYFTLILHQEEANKYGLFKDFLTENDKLLKYKRRLYEKALIRLEAIGLIEQLKHDRRVYYKVTSNGNSLVQLRLDAEDSLFNYLIGEIKNTFSDAKPTIL